MKPKHFTFNIDSFSISNSNALQNIKIQQNIKNYHHNKNGFKRFSIKNQLNFQQIPQIMFFQKSIKKPKNESKTDKNSKIQTKKSALFFQNNLNLNLNKKVNDNKQNKKQGQAHFRSNKVHQNKSMSRQFFSNQNKYNSLINQQKQNLITKPKYFKKIYHQNYHLQSLQECQSQFDKSSSYQIIKAKPQCTDALRLHQNNLKISEKQKLPNKNKLFDQEKQCKNKKNEKSNNSKGNQQNPEVTSNKERNNRQSQKNQQKIGNSVFVNGNRKTKDKFISFNRKSYYLIGSKNSKYRSLNKDKKTKNESLMEEANILLTNGYLTENSAENPSSNCRNTSVKSSNNSQIKSEHCISGKEIVKKKNKLIQQAKADSCIIEIVKKTGQILNKYKEECIQLKKQKNSYQEKYQQTIKKLQQIKKQIQLAIKS